MMRRFLILVTLILAVTLLHVLPSPLVSYAYAEDEVGGKDEDLDSKKEGTPATSEPTTVDKDGNPIKCEDLPGAKGGVLVSKIIPCMLKTVETTTSKFSQKMIDWLRPLLYTFLTLVICLYGVRVLQNEPEIYKHGLLLLLKVSIVLTILDNIPNYYVPQTYTIMSESVDIVANVIDASSLHCKDVSVDYKGPHIWAMMDCVLGKLYGFSVGSGGQPNMLLQSSMFGVMSGFFFGGAWGVTVFFAMLGVLISVFMLVIRTILAFINGYLTISILLILCPLLMPLIFLRGTSGYFQKVWSNILGGFLMPIIVTAYAMMALLLYDQMLFSDGKTDPNTGEVIEQPSMMKTLFDGAKISEALSKPKKACDHPISGDATDVRFVDEPDSAAMSSKFTSPFLQNTLVHTMSGANDPCTLLGNVEAFNVNDVKDPAYKKGKETFQKMFEQLAQLLILGWLLAKGQDEVMKIIPYISGGASLAKSAQMEIASLSEFKLKKAVEIGGQDFKMGLSGLQGYDFLKKIPGASKDSFGKFMGGVRR